MHSRQTDRDMSIDDRPQAIGITFLFFVILFLEI
jgi:hypothetical protein